jgi:hypothetical protein
MTKARIDFARFPLKGKLIQCIASQINQNVSFAFHPKLLGALKTLADHGGVGNIVDADLGEQFILKRPSDGLIKEHITVCHRHSHRSPAVPPGKLWPRTTKKSRPFT